MNFVLFGGFLTLHTLDTLPGELFYGIGAVSFKNSIDDVQDGIYMVKNVCETTLGLTANVARAADDVEEQSHPKDTGEPICGLDSESSTQIRSSLANIDQLRSTVDEHLLNIDGDVLYVLNLMGGIENALHWPDIFLCPGCNYRRDNHPHRCIINGGPLRT